MRHSIELDRFLASISTIHVVISQYVILGTIETIPSIEERAITRVGLAEIP
jgi:hypothetical protein